MKTTRKVQNMIFRFLFESIQFINKFWNCQPSNLSSFRSSLTEFQVKSRVVGGEVSKARRESCRGRWWPRHDTRRLCNFLKFSLINFIYQPTYFPSAMYMENSCWSLAKSFVYPDVLIKPGSRLIFIVYVRIVVNTLL